jgi:phosphoenolpyruvate carboxykinase (GTP)
MLVKNQGVDIIQEIGQVTTLEAAKEVFAKSLDQQHLERLAPITNQDVLLKIANAIVTCQPEKVYINTGSDEDRAYFRNWALDTGEESTLTMDGHTIHYDLKEEQGRIVDRTFYIANPGEQISSLANKIDRSDALIDVREKFSGIMRGKTMMVGFFMRGPVGAPVSNPALEITSSAYVSHSAEILYRNAYADFDNEVKKLGHFYANIHSQGQNRAQDLPDARVYMDRSHWTTYSVNCTYAGNTLLLKKGNHRFSVDKAVYENRGVELSEHMFITGLKGPGGRITWCAGAAPSGCGKTTTAMAGDYFVGDDLAQMWIAKDGSIRSVNPECGIFGIVEDVNRDGDPQLMKLLREQGTEVIWSNVLIDEKNVPHWVGNGEEAPTKGKNFQGPWEKGMTDKDGKALPISHPNARCTLSSSALANYSDEAENPAGVETRIITYSGRDADTMPPVWAATSADQGVAIGACIVSAATATEVGATGVKRAPWANAPFIPGALGDYMDAQFVFFNSAALVEKSSPVMAGLNYFLTDAARGGTSSKLLGEKRDVKVWLGWLERKVHGDVKTIKTPIGHLPLYQDLKDLFKDLIDKDYAKDLYDKQFSLYVDKILARINLQLEAYGKEENIPEKLFDVLKTQQKELEALKAACGSIVTPEQIIAAA